MIKKFFGSVFLQACAVVFALLMILELTARTEWLHSALPYRSVGDADYQFEIKWFKLQDYARRNGGVDIIVLGNSLVNTGVDPEVMSQEYYHLTGKQPRIFNFGVEGLFVAPTSIIARILVETYHPALLIFVTDMRDYIESVGLEYEQLFLSNDWIQYKQGKFNPAGWLVGNSQALQDYLPYRNWMRADFPKTIYNYVYRYADTTDSGYERDNSIGVNIDVPPSRSDPNEAVNFDAYGNYKIASSRLEDLKHILNLRQIGTRVLVVEMPVHPTFYVYVGGESVHRKFQQTISSTVLNSGNMFIPAEACIDIPLQGRSGRGHLNYIGAPIFSTCLGEQLAALSNPQNNYFIKPVIKTEK